ncbi:hypothetical protein EHS13_18920 [Paenibacillus psychroresistens]|uniref:Uncharacterized protein n=1 Tax=Paenibacillus psychroresistens TaxID=1778678 RepID=A0A6B8RM27_9BACL|nr:hypothetical protein [Paenibacillus psychroresistens]QGQ96804.1 hypothetical protein EHS13_18920 [Paenibacillus psychroresistens]
MKTEQESKDLLVWQEAPLPQEKSHTKVVELSDYRRSQESTIVSWDVPAVEAIKPVKLIMVSSGFTIRSFGGNGIQSMAA